MGELYTGYHGTTISRGESILKNKYYFVSYKEDEWLGNGVYFFEKDIYQAVDFCTKARRYDDYIILKSKIEAEICIDLDRLETMTILDKIAKKINKRYKNLTNGRYTKLTNCEILEDLYRIKPYDLVKKTFVIQKRDKIQNTNFLWVQVQMCVRNRDCIKTIEEVIRNERSYVLN